MAATMRSVVANSGRPETVERSISSYDDDQVLVKVDAIALNHIDLAIMNGHTHAGAGGENAALGIEYAGIVAGFGRNAQHLRLGQRVMCSGPGALSEYAVTDRGHVLPAFGADEDP